MSVIKYLLLLMVVFTLTSGAGPAGGSGKGRQDGRHHKGGVRGLKSGFSLSAYGNRTAGTGLDCVRNSQSRL